MAGQPFPLYPGEELILQPTPLTIVACQSALRLTAIRDFDDKVAGCRLPSLVTPSNPTCSKSSHRRAARATHTATLRWPLFAARIGTTPHDQQHRLPSTAAAGGRAQPLPARMTPSGEPPARQATSGSSRDPRRTRRGWRSGS